MKTHFILVTFLAIMISCDSKGTSNGDANESTTDSGPIDQMTDADVTEDNESDMDVDAGFSLDQDISVGGNQNLGEPGNVMGTVYMPGNGPHQVGAEDSIPVLGALVYITDEEPPPLPTVIYCDACVQVDRSVALTDVNGHFRINDVRPGERWLVVQKGLFRRITRVNFLPSFDFEIPPQLTTLPSENNETEGLSIPRIALASGNYDSLEDILAKMGLGELSFEGMYIRNSAQSRFDVYDNGGPEFSDEQRGTMIDLVSDYTLLSSYHIILIPCSNLFDFTEALQDPGVRSNLRSYVSRGGKLFVTDWSGEWVDNIFPTQIELGDDEDTPPEAYDPLTNTWDSSLFGDANGAEYDTPNAEVVDEGLSAWLGAQTGPNINGERVSYNPEQFRITGSFNIIQSVNDVILGYNAQNEEVIDRPKVWVIGGSDAEPEPKRPMTVTYEPTGCGRVLYTTYHTTDELHEGLVEQERILLYLLMEISVCRDPKSIVSMQ